MYYFFNKILHSRKFEYFSTLMTAMAVFLFILVNQFSSLDDGEIFVYIELTFGMMFIAEYSIRLLGSERPLREVVRPLMIIDLLVVISFALPIYLVHLRFIRMLRLLTILRGRRYKVAMTTIVNVINDEKESIIIVGVFFLMLILFSASLMSLVEYQTNPGFSSIMKSMYWAIITSTGVGYGDLVPMSGFGKVIANVTAIFGVLLYSMMTAVFGNGFAKELKKGMARKEKLHDQMQEESHMNNLFLNISKDGNRRSPMY